MATINTDAIKNAIQDLGEPVSVEHYLTDQTYDSDQNPTRSSTTTATQAHITNPSRNDIETGLNKITIDDKKFEFPKGILIDIGDVITLTRTSEPFSVKLVNKIEKQGLRVKTIAFASQVE